MVQSILQVTDITPVCQPAEIEKGKFSRTDVRNVSRKFNPPIKKMRRLGEESQKTPSRRSDDHNTSLSNSLYYMKSRIKEIWVLCKR